MDNVMRGTITVRDLDVLQVEKRTNRTGTLARFPAHVHNDYQIVYAPAIVNQYTYRGARHVAPPASLTILHPNEVHDAVGLADLSRDVPLYVFHLCPQFVKGFHREEDAFSEVDGSLLFETIVSGRHMVQQLERLAEATFAPGASHLNCQERLVRFIVDLTARYSSSPGSARDLSPDHRLVNTIREYLYAHANENISIDTLCRISGTSRTRLCGTFRRTTGISLHAFQIQVRVERARTLLVRSGASLSETARDTGFADQSHFARHFKRLVGVSPGCYQVEKGA
ncbi:MAG: helix-turn-helix transcriptional regulator [Fibrella sp.]|nr:helix-turn-helix transcriptional regulator [Armatimonadota bacterium]